MHQNLESKALLASVTDNHAFYSIKKNLTNFSLRSLTIIDPAREHTHTMGKAEKLTSSSTYPTNRSKKAKTIDKVTSRIDKTDSPQPAHANTVIELTEMIENTEEVTETEESWETVVHHRSKKLPNVPPLTTTTTSSCQPMHLPNSNAPGVHSYFSFGHNNTRQSNAAHKVSQKSTSFNQQQSREHSSPFNHKRKDKVHLPPFQLEFEVRQKPPEILVLNDLVKNNDRLNVTTALYSTRPLSSHVLLIFANDPSTYELLLERSSWPTSICGLTFKVTIPSRTPTAYSVLVNRVPREWSADAIKDLIAERYLSTIQAARIFRDDQPINRIRVDFRSNEDVQRIHQCSHIALGSLRYPAVPYKPLVRIDRCFRCQQFGHKAAHCSNESKCYKCGQSHAYNRDCANAIQCANCDGRHMAGSPECPVKISYRKEKIQQQQEQRTSEHSTSPYLSSPAKLYSNVLHSLAPTVHGNPTLDHLPTPCASNRSDQSSVIITALKEEILRSQDILLNRMTALEMQCSAAHEQQAALQWTLNTQIVPYITTMSELLVDVCDQLATAKAVSLSDHHRTKL